MPQQVVVGESTGHPERLRVVGDGDVTIAAVSSGLNHFLGGILAVAPRGMHMEIACNIRGFDQVRQPASFGRLHFTPIFPQHRRDVGQTELLKNLGLLESGNAPVVFIEQAVLIELEIALNRPIAQDDVVCLGAGEVLHRGAPAFRGHEPQVGLVAAQQADTALGVAMPEHPFDPGRFEERAHQGGRLVRGYRRAYREDVDVSARLAPSAQAADRHELDLGRAVAEVSRELGSDRRRIGQQRQHSEDCDCYHPPTMTELLH